MKIKTSPEGSKNFERPHVEEGLYEAELKEVKDISEGQYGKRVAFVFEVLIKDKKAELSHITYVPEIATPENKFGKVLQAFGCDLGSEIETDSLKGSSVRVMVEDYEYEEDKEKKIASTISKVKPLVQTQKVE
jgi:hypothetical protein